MRVIFFGTSAFAVPSLEQLAHSRHALTHCVTQPDRPGGRGLKPEPSPVKVAANRLGLPLSQPERLTPETFSGLDVEVGVVVAYGNLIPPALLRWPPHGMIGVHPSLLPRYRGAAPVAWTLLQGETETGVTIFRLNERLDAGALILQERVTIYPEESCAQLTERLAQLGARALVQSLDALEAGEATFTAQEESQATLAPKLTKAQGRIDWSQSAQGVVRLVRAMQPWPGASTMWRGQDLKILAADLARTHATCQQPPGSVLEIGKDELMVAAVDGTVAIRALQLAGRRPMTVAEFLRGHPLKVGERLS